MMMVEKVARALCEQQIRHARRFDTPPPELEALMSRGVDYAWKDYRETARVAIAAMSQPSEAMLDRFVSRALCVSVHGEGGWSDYARGQWQTMIQAALDEKEGV